MIDLDFIKRCMAPDFQDQVKQFRKAFHWKNNNWQRKNPEKQRESQRQYENTDKGRYARSKAIYRNRITYQKYKFLCQKQEVSWDERILIGRFYKNCPKGYEVDHIVPVSRGGLHCLSNLQYLTKEENKRKGTKH